jgi:hypothetical protein
MRPRKLQLNRMNWMCYTQWTAFLCIWEVPISNLPSGTGYTSHKDENAFIHADSNYWLINRHLLYKMLLYREQRR